MHWLSEDFNFSQSEQAKSNEVSKFLVDLKLLDIDFLICLRLCIKFEENTTDPFGSINISSESYNSDGDNSDVSD